jgi:glycerol-3-phosphate dehydrogenase
MTGPRDESRHVQVDVAIFGGGVAGLWTLSLLRNQGYNAVLFESNTLGGGQTRYAQGIIHGGTKYALTGKLTASSEAIAEMPSFWRACLQGNGELDLSNVKLMSEHQYLWSTASLTSRMAGFFASHAMRSRTKALSESERPKVFQDKQFKGQVYKLDEPVLDTASLVNALAASHKDAMSAIKQVTAIDDTLVVTTTDNKDYSVKAKHVVLTAGKGNKELLAAFGKTQPEMQLRPLQMVMVRGGLPEMIYAHCLGASVNPRITITSHKDSNDDIVWYLGGQLAEEGVQRTAEQQINEARKELSALMPWLDLSKTQWATLPIDRAEPQMPGGKRPDDVFVGTDKHVSVCWPTKLAFAPRLANKLIAQIQEQGINPSAEQVLPSWPQPEVAKLPWQEEEFWS